ncbi:hypothetical protein [Mycolicibacterium peregrinum]|uniref:hypothetical protein n=1 Tax=Mycolicibacterium peregrinum TaxID=43304 RepID=UPI0013F4E3A1|nr:hypothetical protein [Mycolicibacterium peregrinum]
MSQSLAPTSPMMLWHRLDDIGRFRFAHGSKHALAGDGMAGADHVGCDQRTFGNEDLGGRSGVEAGDKSGQAARIQQVHGCAGRGQLHGMSPFGGEVHISPSDCIGRQSRDEAPEAEPSEHCAESHFDTDGLDATVMPSCEHYVGDAGKPLTGDVDDLGVEYISYELDLVRFQGGPAVGASRCRGGRREPDSTVLKCCAFSPEQQQPTAVTCVNDEAVYHHIV